ncbi:hypothetical protein PG985_011568 [Apiospora marii]|uniref:2EXR domain-containing protein n=1 Tax=Apiospora marii TaxID=335849 RepID=A0ABR1R1D6_9PEZI
MAPRDYMPDPRQPPAELVERCKRTYEFQLSPDECIICPHLEGPAARKLAPPSIEAQVGWDYPLDRTVPAGRETSLGNLSVTPEQLEPWLRMIRDMLLEADKVPRHLVRPILQTLVPKLYHSLPLVVAVPEDVSTRTFFPFSRLPSELRCKIWALAAHQRPRIVDFTIRTCEPPLNGARDVPTVAKTCSEAWHFFMAKGSYWKPIWTARGNGQLKYWAFDTDIAYLRKPRDQYWRFPKDSAYTEEVHEAYLTDYTDTREPVYHYPDVWDKYWDYDFLQSRKTLAIDYDHFVNHAARGGQYAWLRDSEAIETLILVHTQKPCVNITMDEHTCPDCCGPVIHEMEYINIWSEYHFCRQRRLKRQTQLVMYDEPGELERLNNLWRGLDPNGLWLYRDARYEYLEASSMWDKRYRATCVTCELESGQKMVAGARRAWLQLISPSSVASASGNGENEAGQEDEGQERRVPNFRLAVEMEFHQHQMIPVRNEVHDCSCLDDIPALWPLWCKMKERPHQMQ